jgi:hypothetical protein
MIFIYRPSPSQSARLLAESVDGVRMRREENLRRRVKANDKVVMWGACVNGLQGKVVNNVPLGNKFEDAVRLKNAGVRTVEVSRVKPVPEPVVVPVDPLIAIWEDAQDAAEAFCNLGPTRNAVAIQGLTELVTKVQATKNAAIIAAPVAPPAKPIGEWLGRTFNHVAANDLLNANVNPDFFSKKEAFVNEYRVHSFFGRSIRAGRKVPRTPQSETPFHGTPHQWIRSFDSGWQISYADDSGVKQKHRDIAHAAIKALGLDFGAVDIGELADGSLVVLEVNRAPGVEAGTTTAYGRAIRRWIEGEWETVKEAA